MDLKEKTQLHVLTRKRHVDEKTKSLLSIKNLTHKNEVKKIDYQGDKNYFLIF